MGATSKTRLLVVEDDPGYQYLIQLAFAHPVEEARWEVTLANNGEEALHALFDEESESPGLPELILLDWNLPRINGSEVLQRIKRHRVLRRIPVLVFSSSESEEDIRTAYDEHANGYILKPGSLDALKAMVETIERFWISIVQLPRVAHIAH
jgi:two-component system, chemotaxis family, response regulator Rcp1